MRGKFSAAIVTGLAAAFAAPLADADVMISTDPTQNMSCSGGVCTATAKKAVLNVGDLTNMLAAGDTGVKSSVGRNIDIDQPFSWSSASRLTLDAKDSITVKKPVTVAGAGAITITYNDGGSGGDLQFVGKGKVDFPNPESSLTINGNSYALIFDVAAIGRSGNYALAMDYDAGAVEYNDSPVAFLGGTFEGLGHAIAHLNISERLRIPQVGLFGEVAGAVRDIALVHINLSVDKAMEGGAVAGINGGTIEYVRASGKIRAKERTQDVGGLVGWNQGTIFRSVSEISGEAAGGISGVNLGQIDQCFALGDISKAGGGLVGNLGQGTVSNSYAASNVLSGQGGLVGYGSIDVVSSYSIGQVARINGSGGFVGTVDSNAVQNAYWDTDTSGQSQGCGSGNCAGITGLSDAQLKSGLPAGFDPKIWAHDPKINNGYPYLINNPPQQ